MSQFDPYPGLPAGIVAAYDIATDCDIVKCVTQFKGPLFLEGKQDGKIVIKRTSHPLIEKHPAIDLVMRIKNSITQRMEVKIPCAGFDYAMVYKYEDLLWPNSPAARNKNGRTYPIQEALTIVYAFTHFEEVGYSVEMPGHEKDSMIAKCREEKARREQVEVGKNMLLDILNKNNA